MGVKASWIARRAREGKVPHVMLGRWRRYDADALEEWWRGRIVGAGPTPRGGEGR
jgi:excisionase family DNA binding protein